MAVLNNIEIDAHCAGIVSYANNYNACTFALFSLLYDTGARVGDMLNNNTILFDPNTSVLSYFQQKTGVLRSINMSNPTFYPVAKIPAMLKLAETYSYTTATRDFSRCTGGAVFVIGGKNVGTHIFRHNLAKRMHDNGLTISQVAVLLGVSNINTANIYVNSIIQKTSLL